MLRGVHYLEPESEPELEAAPELEPEPETFQDPEPEAASGAEGGYSDGEFEAHSLGSEPDGLRREPEPEVEAEPDVELEPEPEPESESSLPVPEPEPEPDPAPELEPGPEPPEPEPEPDPEHEPDPQPDSEPEPEPGPAGDPLAAPPAPPTDPPLPAARTLASNLDATLVEQSDQRVEAAARAQAEQDAWPAVGANGEELVAPEPADAGPEMEVTFDQPGPLGIVFRSTVPSVEGRAFVRALKPDSTAAKHEELCAAKEAAERAGLCLVLTAVDGEPLQDAGEGLYRAGLAAVKSAGRPVLLRLGTLLAPPKPPSRPREPEPEPEPEPEAVAVPAEADLDPGAASDGEQSTTSQRSQRGAAATRKTRNALLGGLRSGTLEGAVEKMEDDMYMEELRTKDPAAWIKERDLRAEALKIAEGGTHMIIDFFTGSNRVARPRLTSWSCLCRGGDV